MEEIQKTPHIILVPTPGMGHLIPLLEFAKRLICHHDFSVTMFIPTDGPSSKAQETVLNSLPNSIHYSFLPPVNFDDLPDDVKAETRISLTITRSLGFLKDALTTLVEEKRVNVVAMVVDLFGADAFDVGMEFNLHCYIFFPSTATCLSLFLELPNLDETCLSEYRDMSEPVRLPGCVPLRGSDLVDPCQDRKNEAYKWLLHHANRYKSAEGILVNSFMEVEPGPLKELTAGKPGRPPVYPVGPLVRTSVEKVDGDECGCECECLRWLDSQPEDSVLFISFGSGGTLSIEQLTELAIGLEMSGRRFLWVVKSPSEKAANASYFTAQSSDNPFDFLPEGFLERTKEVGLVVQSWAPQVQVLSHSSTGGFLTHCGWNSTLESVLHGVPLIAWPLYAEQKMNAAMLEAMKMALRVRRDESGLIPRDEITKAVKGLMGGEEGKEVKKKMEELKSAAANVLSQDGDSTKKLSEVALKWK